MSETTDLIQLVQEPIISEKLQAISQAIDDETNKAISLACTEENKTEIKKVRANLNKQFADLETKRKEIKAEISKPYDDFMEKVYNPLIATKFKNADEQLKEKIDTVENEIKENMRSEIEQYFNDYANSLEIDFLDFSNANINILLSKSDKALKTECREYIDKIKKDLDFIDTQENKEEILYEYKNHDYNLRDTLQVVEIRKRAIEEEKKNKEEKEKAKENATQRQNEIVEIINEYSEIEQPKQEEELQKPTAILTCTFTVTATVEQLKELKQFLNDNHIDYK